MRFHTHISCAFLLTFIVTVVHAQSTDTALTSRKGVLLLRNGQTLEGNVTRTGDDYLVTRGVTSELRLPAASVEFVCDSLETLYQRKLALLGRATSRTDHIELARWCLQHELTARAADQTLMAFALEPNGVGLDVIERQLLTFEPTHDDTAQVAAKVHSVPTTQEIEATIDALPAGSVQQFVTSVQPLLMNRCATNGCHGHTGESEFQLLRPNSRQSLSRRMTQRNLVSALDFVNRDDPRQSQLLTMMRSPHGGRGAIFSEAETHQMQLLTKWVTGLFGQSVAALPASVAKPPAFLLQTRPEAMAELMNAIPQDAPPAEVSSNPATRTPPVDDYQPRDPFDPEIFNRRTQRQFSDPG